MSFGLFWPVFRVMVPAIGFYWIFWSPNIGVHYKDFNHYVQRWHNGSPVAFSASFKFPYYLITRQNRGVLSGLPNLTCAAAKNCVLSAFELWQAPLWSCLFIVRICVWFMFVLIIIISLNFSPMWLMQRISSRWAAIQGTFFLLFFVFFQWHGDVVEDGGGLSISKLIEWKKKKTISQVLQLQLHFYRFYFSFFFLFFFFPLFFPHFLETAVISFHFCFW